jgi:hypothetical protein
LGIPWSRACKIKLQRVAGNAPARGAELSFRDETELDDGFMNLRHLQNSTKLSQTLHEGNIFIPRLTFKVNSELLASESFVIRGG